jgi:hypothetical protein
MHISLDSALGRQRRLNSVGESVFQIAPNASAGYSLRSLTGGDPTVVRVRRASDNSEKDFNSSGVSSGELVNWVNAQVVPPLDVRELVDGERTGALIPAAAAYSLRNLSASGTSFTTVGDTQTDYFSFTGATGDTAALNGIKYGYAFLYNGAKAYNSAPPAPENTQMVRGIHGNWTLFDASGNTYKAYANSTNVSTEYPWEADWTGTDLENATFSQQSTGSLVTQVRRNTDGELRSFTAAEVTDGTLVAWVLGDAASLVGNAQYFNGTSSEVTTTGLASAIGTQDFKVSFSLGGVATPGRIVQMGDAQSNTAKNGFFISLSSSGTFTIGVDETFSTLTTVRKANGGSYDVVFDRSGDAEIFEDGVSIGTVDISSKSGTSLLNKPLFIGARDKPSNPLRMSGVIYNISIDIGNDGTSNNSYTGLGATPWSDTIGSNNGTPSNLATFTGQGLDGTVSKWYDQSTTSGVPNANHAVQTSVARQPKIVDAGVLVSGGIDFDGVDDGLFTAGNFTDTLQSATIFALTQDDTTSGVASMLRIRPNGQFGIIDGVNWEKTSDRTYGGNTLFEGDNGAVSAPPSGQGTRNTSKNLNTLVYQQSQILAYENGLLDETLNTVSAGSVPVGDVTLVDQLWLGQNFDDNARPFNGTMSEVIVYFTDQSDNRTAFEANIGETYGIDLPSGVDTGYDEVDGFVETWYDQSSSVVTNYDPYPSSQFQASGNTSYWSATPTAGTDGTGWDLVSDLGNDSTNNFGSLLLASNYTASKVRVGKHRVEFDLTLNSGVIDNGASNLGDRPLVLVTRDLDDDPTTSAFSNFYEVVEGFNSIDVEVFDDGIETPNLNFEPSIFLSARPHSVFDVTVSNLEVSHVTEPIVRNGNDAVQSVAGSQPKIVDAGVLVSGGLKFDGVDDEFNTSLIPPSTATLIGVATWDVELATQMIIGARDSANERSYLAQTSSGDIALGVGAGAVGTQAVTASTEYLAFGKYNSGDNDVFVNTLASGSSATASPTNTTYGYNVGSFNDAGNSSGMMNGRIREVIIYNSDQSANREAIEDNINNQYDIY